MKTLIKSSAALFFFALVITLVQTVHADTTNAQNFGEILNQAKNISNTGANQINNGSVTTGNATAGQDVNNTINTSATGCNCTPTPSAQPTGTPAPSPTPTNTPGGGDGGCHGDCGANNNNNGGGSGGGSSTGQVLGLSATSGTNQTLQTLTLIASFLSALGGAFLLKKNA